MCLLLSQQGRWVVEIFCICICFYFTHRFIKRGRREWLSVFVFIFVFVFAWHIVCCCLNKEQGRRERLLRFYSILPSTLGQKCIVTNSAKEYLYKVISGNFDKIFSYRSMVLGAVHKWRHHFRRISTVFTSDHPCIESIHLTMYSQYIGGLKWKLGIPAENDNAIKGTFQKLLSGFCPLGGEGSTPLFR